MAYSLAYKTLENGSTLQNVSALKLVGHSKKDYVIIFTILL